MRRLCNVAYTVMVEGRSAEGIRDFDDLLVAEFVSESVKESKPGAGNRGMAALMGAIAQSGSGKRR